MRFLLRPLRARDRRVLQTATLGNVNWREERFTMAQAVADPSIAHYMRLRPVRGDVGLVLETERDRTRPGPGESGPGQGPGLGQEPVAAGERAGLEPVGVAWALFLGSADPGYGFLGDDIPEVSLWVAPTHRGRGLGRRLLRELLAELNRQGHATASLSVEEDNPARGLYLSEGFTPVAGREADGVLRWDSPGSTAN